MAQKFSLYFSHSWNPENVDLNLAVWRLVWQQLRDRCILLVDLPEGSQENPPYYINRIEELLRRSDVFLAVLPYRAEPPAATPAVEDSSLACSKAILFEIRLAERANRPRLILYDIRTRFKPPKNPPPHAKYVARNFAELQQHLPRLEPQLEETVSSWLVWVCRSYSPRFYEPSDVSLLLVPDGLPARGEVIEQIRLALMLANYQEPEILQSSFSSDAGLFRLLGNGGLLVAEISDLTHLSIYCIAHALFIPSVRLLRSAAAGSGSIILDRLPWILRGHPGGYQHDIVTWAEPQQLRDEVWKHAAAMFLGTHSIISYEGGHSFFASHRYGKHSVFISHNLKGTERVLVDAILTGLTGAAIKSWEYAEENRAGEEWKAKMLEALGKATHFVILLTGDYEQSPACVEEVEWALEHLSKENILVFFVGDRRAPHVKLRPYTHQSLSPAAQDGAAEVLARVQEVLTRSK